MVLIFKINYSRQYHTKCKEKLAKAWGGGGEGGSRSCLFSPMNWRETQASHCKEKTSNLSSCVQDFWEILRFL